LSLATEAVDTAATEDDRSTKKIRIRADQGVAPMEAFGTNWSDLTVSEGTGGSDFAAPEVSVGTGGSSSTAAEVLMEEIDPQPAAPEVNMEESGPTPGGGASAATDSDELDVEGVQCNEGDISFVAGKYGPVVRLSEGFKERLERRWDYAVVVKLLSRTIGYRTLCARLQTLWQPTRSLKVVDLDNDFYLVRFDCEEDYFKALVGGPWVIMGHALSVRPWDLSFRASEGRVSQAVIWAHFVDFPPSWYNSEVLQALGSWVGGPMKALPRVTSMETAISRTSCFGMDMFDSQANHSP
ncbi:hypothetical protein Tsubulata_049293, partial [Turnera subulata]